jgi:N-methylhydantoinase B
VLFEEYSLHEGSGGPGEHRGGFGVNYRVRLRRGEARASMVMDHGRFGPQGARGGRDGGVNRVRIIRDGAAYTPPHLSKDQDIRLREGDLIEVSTPGGGGFGNPFLRAPESVAGDVAKGYYTRQQAETSFGVVVSEDGAVDCAATDALRGTAAGRA